MLQTAVGPVPEVTSTLSWRDLWGHFLARWGVGRMHFTVDPGIYALGRPGQDSPVLVTANYKMSFDRLRASLPGKNAWILVLDTKGINVWCAAGKGTFGTRNLVHSIESMRLKELVSHRLIILPQLGAPGVAAHLVSKSTGFKVIYGPIKAEDLPAFLDGHFHATPEMRKKTFTTWERAVLIPVEFVTALKWTLIVAPVFFLLGGMGGPEGFWATAMDSGLFAVYALFTALAAGVIFTPLFLPWLPGRAFTLKGMCMGILCAGCLALYRGWRIEGWPDSLEILGWFFLVPALAGYFAMNFTGASTYTSLSGVRKEMKWAVPAEIGAGITGLVLWLGSRLLA
ncbi:MAG: acetyl-CoA synthase subunit gamma [Deltaproteobacteria bacterium]|nr:acetyl-CoA synthase subunit gamma [Deltaproteobacteria bacterium]MBW2018315.1 acetyl-CoA synthase subunit gamma [Deltaproteobacteria bacterium]MBW2130498.1 acetyl-CoA synthase subunit gamma [Deltaproteobacteria bacterium]MBW2303686.1 acetyl-CoA synthase subunit gamma [Deltaproteobacteria bacterium]